VGGELVVFWGTVSFEFGLGLVVRLFLVLGALFRVLSFSSSLSSCWSSISTPSNVSIMVTNCLTTLAAAGAFRSPMRTIDWTIFLNFTRTLDFSLIMRDPPLIDSTIILREWRLPSKTVLGGFDDGIVVIFLIIAGVCVVTIVVANVVIRSGDDNNGCGNLEPWQVPSKATIMMVRRSSAVLVYW